MKKIRFLLICSFIIVIILMSGCSKKTGTLSCKSDSDCPDKNCMVKLCENRNCYYNPIPNCCGNGIKEEIEDGMPGNKCSCPQDYGKCVGSVNEYLEYKCTDYLKCVIDVKTQTSLTKTSNIDLPEISLTVDSVFKQPFNLKRDTLDIEILVTDIKDYVSGFKIINIELLMKEKRTQLRSLGKKQVGKYLWGVGDKIDEGLILNFVTDEDLGELKNLMLKLDYQYERISKSGTKSMKTDSTIIGYDVPGFTYVNPLGDYTCPSDCDDENPATRDYCSEETGFFCYNEFIPNACGNYICEKGENKCTCTTDCGRCEGEYKNYLKWQCVDNQCLRVANIEPEKHSILDERTIYAYDLVFKYNYSIPFDVASSTFDFEVGYVRMSEPLSYLMLTSIYLLEGDKILGGTDNPIKIKPHPHNISGVSIPMSFELTEGEEEVKDIILKIDYEYPSEEGTGKGTYRKKFDDFYFFNPEYR